jgi:hypothetical protein
VRESVITYDGLPIASGGAHRLRTQDIETAANSLQSFVNAVSADSMPSAVQFELVSGPGTDERRFAELVAEHDARYGKRRIQALGKHRASRWNVPTSALKELVARSAFISSDQRDIAIQPVAILASWTINLIDPRSGRLLPHQDPQDYGGFAVGDGRLLGRSTVFARLASRTTANLWLSLPFQEPTEEARIVASHIQVHFPCSLSQKHWKRWDLTKSRTYRARKIEPLC